MQPYRYSTLPKHEMWNFDKEMNPKQVDFLFNNISKPPVNLTLECKEIKALPDLWKQSLIQLILPKAIHITCCDYPVLETLIAQKAKSIFISNCPSIQNLSYPKDAVVVYKK